MEAGKIDQRREAGVRTRTRLMDAALDLLARRGEDGVTLREVTDAAGANVSAVSYHFGSLQSLYDAAIEHALERYLDAQSEAVNALGPESTLEELATAFARPMIRALTAGGPDLAIIRTVARAGLNPPEAWVRFDATFDRINASVLRVLRTRTPGVNDRELIFRTRWVAGMVNWLALAPLGADLVSQSGTQIERRLVPILAGAFRG